MPPSCGDSTYYSSLYAYATGAWFIYSRSSTSMCSCCAHAGSELVRLCLSEMVSQGCEEVALEAEVTNVGALRLYENLGFIRDKRLQRWVFSSREHAQQNFLPDCSERNPCEFFLFVYSSMTFEGCPVRRERKHKLMLLNNRPRMKSSWLKLSWHQTCCRYYLNGNDAYRLKLLVPKPHALGDDEIDVVKQLEQLRMGDLPGKTQTVA